MAQTTRMTLGTARVLIALANEQAALYTAEVQAKTGLPDGSVHTILLRLRNQGLLTCQVETGGGDKPHVYRDENAKVGRGRRHYHALTPAGSAAAEVAMSRFPRELRANTDPADAPADAAAAEAAVHAQLAGQLARHVIAEMASSVATYTGDEPPEWMSGWDDLDGRDGEFLRLTAERIGVALYRRGYAAGASVHAARVHALERKLATAQAELGEVEAAYSELAAKRSA